MIYRFITIIRKEANRSFAPIPFNVWEETGLKGNIPCRICAGEHTFECKLVPKGGGMYWIPIKKAISDTLPQTEEISIELEPIESLSRINHNSPYSKNNPIRKIDGIREIPVVPGYCGQCCVAMLSGAELSEVISLMGQGHASWSKILEALDYYGITYSQKAVYPRGKTAVLPQCCIVNMDNSFLLWYKGTYCSAGNECIGNIISYIEIFLS